MSWLKAIAAVCFAAIVSGCGFVPIAAPSGTAGAKNQIVVRDIKIDGAGSRFQYQLRRGLVSFVSIDPKARYALSISVDIKRTSLAITADDEITRFNFEAITKYKLVGVADDPVIDGETRAITSVNATTDTFATQSSERAAMQKLADATSEKLITALRLISLRAKSEK